MSIQTFKVIEVLWIINCQMPILIGGQNSFDISFIHT